MISGYKKQTRKSKNNKIGPLILSMKSKSVSKF